MNAITTTQMKDAASVSMLELARAMRRVGYLALEASDRLAILRHEADQSVFDIEVERERMARLRAEIDALKEEDKK